ncbi:MAG TPA: hypothetical protein VFF40_06915 [Acidimicrobiia bacterium]|nr:hypothetical protein [Acidimicrobiia bacterium]
MSEPVAVRIGRPDGAYRRRIRVEHLTDTTVRAALEDDFHHFVVEMRHDNARAIGFTASSMRWPWSTCPDAAGQLAALDGMALSPRCTAAAAVANPRLQCTHQFDLAGLAVAHATRPTSQRQYDIEIPPARPDGRRVVRLWRDGALLHEWTLEPGKGLVTPAPAPFTEAPWRGGFIKWAEASLEPDEAEAAIVLRRACDIGMGRGMDLEAYRTAAELADLMTGVCYTMQPDVMSHARRSVGSIRDFADAPDALLGDVEPGTDSAPSGSH